MLTGSYVYFWRNRENLPLPIRIKLSKNPKMLSCIYFGFLESTLNFQCSEIKVNLFFQVFLKLFTPKNGII